MKPRNFFILLGVLFTVAGVLIWNIISNYNDRQENKSSNAQEVVMYKNPGCQCCQKWANYLRQHGYKVSVNEPDNMPAIKAKYHVPQDMQSCHTAIINGYVVEGHVPIQDINQLLQKHPAVVGIAAPGMPASSPGMNTALNEPYNVYLFSGNGSTLFRQH